MSGKSWILFSLGNWLLVLEGVIANTISCKMAMIYSLTSLLG